MKKILVLLTILIIITGCKNSDKFYLDDNCYKDGTYIEISKEELDNLQNNKSSYLIFTYNSFCTFKVPCDNIFETVMKKYNINIYKMPYELMKKTFIYEKVKYAPSIIIIKKGEIIGYLDAEKDSDLEKYQDADKFEEWLSKYIYLKK